MASKNYHHAPEGLDGTGICVARDDDGQAEGKAASMAVNIRYWRSIRIAIRAAPQGPPRGNPAC